MKCFTNKLKLDRVSSTEILGDFVSHVIKQHGYLWLHIWTQMFCHFLSSCFIRNKLVFFSFQVLQSWLQGLPDDYAVKDLINKIKDWIEEDYVKDTVWKRLQNCVVPGVLPTFSKRRSPRKRSASSSIRDSPERKKTTPSGEGSEVTKGKISLFVTARIPKDAGR